jgi:hypothetical protein
MTSIATTAPATGRKAQIAGWAVTGLLTALFLMDAGMKLAVMQIVVDGSKQMGWPADAGTIRTLGLLLAISAVLYAVPRTAFLGAILLTGYLGGAIATHVRVADPLFTHTLFGVYLGVALWGALWLRDARLRALIPLSN